MERDRLPHRPMIDTGVLIRWLGDRKDAWSADCSDFVEACIKSRRTVFVAAPTLAEVIRHKGARPPRTTGIVIVPFDERTAELLGTKFPIDVIKATGSSSGLPHSYLKYDALIAACALRANADALVALDGDHTKLASHAGIKVAAPATFRSPQLPLPQP